MHQVTMQDTGQTIPVGKILCLGQNYLDHIRELGNQVTERPVVFSKPTTSLIGDGGIVQIPDYTQDCHHELELALLIGRPGKRIDAAAALDYVAGYAVALDLTLRDLQRELKEQGLPWDLAKGFDTSCPLSPFVAAKQIADPNQLELILKVNGHLRQRGNTAQMMRPVEEIVAQLSTYFTLEAGDIILTGTPAGVSRIVSGDHLEGTIEQVGRLQVTVA